MSLYSRRARKNPGMGLDNSQFTDSLGCEGKVSVSSRAVAAFAEMTASITQFHCRAEVKTAPKGRVTPKILSKLHGLCSVRKHTLKFPGFRKFRDPETEFCKEP